VAKTFIAAMTGLGFDRLGLLSVVDPLNPGPRGVAIVHNQAEWIAHYSAEGYYRIDPIHQRAQRQATPFTWSTPNFRDGLDPLQLRMMDELGEAKLGDGVVIPLRTPGELPAACALFTASNDVALDGYHVAHSMTVFAHAAACRLLREAAPEADAPKLTVRERECLVLAARGKSDWEIGRLLNLSERTIHHAIERAKRRLGVATRVQAIVRAIHLGEITTNDVAN
jgi:DNA-binding CsgD family transcriptional regulator